MLFTALEYHVLVTLPLWILSAAFPYFLLLAAASLLASVGICAATGAQAWLPKGKRRWWSRPLVALLFFLQPIVRGWERYRGRLQLRLPEPVRENLDSVTLRNSPESLREVQYWVQRRLERVEFVTRIIEELNRRGWPNRSDIGWSEFDVEIHGNRWSAVQLVTVAEDVPPGRQFLRCRLRGRWSLQAKVALWSLTGLVTLVTSFFGTWWHCLALLLLTLPAFAWFLWRQKRKLQSLVIVFLDELAKELKLVKVPSESEVRRAAQKAQKPVIVPENSPFKPVKEQPTVEVSKDPKTEVPNRA